VAFGFSGWSPFDSWPEAQNNIHLISRVNRDSAPHRGCPARTAAFAWHEERSVVAQPEQTRPEGR